MSIRVLLADDHKIMREGLRSLLDKQADMEVIAEAQDGRTTVKLALKLKPHVVIMDITMPDLNAVEATRQIVDKAPRVKVIGLSMHSDKRYVLRMLRAGASGYPLKDSAFGELAQAIRAIVSGQTFLSPGITGIVIRAALREGNNNQTAAPGLLCQNG